MAPHLHFIDAGVTKVLKISTIEGPKGHRLDIQGKLIPPWTAELKHACTPTLGNSSTGLHSQRPVHKELLEVKEKP